MTCPRLILYSTVRILQSAGNRGERRIAAGAVTDRAGDAGGKVSVLLGHLATGREHDVYAAPGFVQRPLVL